MAKLTTTTIAGGYASTDALNDNFALVETALENTLSRDGTSPNAMGAHLDMNGYRVVNAGASVDGTDLVTRTDVTDIVTTTVVTTVAEQLDGMDLSAVVNVTITDKNATTTHTVSSSDNGTFVFMESGGTVTLPAGLDVGTFVGFISGSGTVAFTAGGGATVNKAATFNATLAETYSVGAAVCYASNTWVVFGDLEIA